MAIEFVTEDGEVISVDVDAEGKPKVRQRKSRDDENAAAFLTGTATQFIDNFLGLPQGLENLGTRASNAINRGAADIFGQRAADFLVGPQAEPDPQVLGFDMPEAQTIFSAADAGLKTALGQGDFSTLFEQEKQTREDLAADNPIATLLGELGGDVATIMTGRVQAPGAPRTAAGGLFDKRIADALASGSKALAPKAGRPGVVKQVKDVVDSELFQKAMRGIGRSAETGLEAAALEIMQDGDPLETAGLAAGGQLAASGALSLAEGAVEIPLRIFGNKKLGTIGEKAVGLAIQGAILSTLFKTFQTDPAAAEETAFDKLTTSIVLGASLGLTGKRTKADGVLSNFPRLADAILTVPRTGMIKAAQALAEDDDTQAVVTAIAENPLVFTEAQIDAIAAGIESGDLPGAIDQLADDPEFRAAAGLTRDIEFVPVDDDDE